MNMPTPETVTDAFKFTEVSLDFFEHDSAKIYWRGTATNIRSRRRAANNCLYHGYYNNDKNNMIRYSHFYQNLYMPRSRLHGAGRRYFFRKISAMIRIKEPSDQRTFGSTNLRNNEPSEQKTFGTAAWHPYIGRN